MFSFVSIKKDLIAAIDDCKTVREKDHYQLPFSKLEDGASSPSEYLKIYSNIIKTIYTNAANQEVINKTNRILEKLENQILNNLNEVLAEFNQLREQTFVPPELIELLPKNIYGHHPSDDDDDSYEGFISTKDQTIAEFLYQLCALYLRLHYHPTEESKGHQEHTNPLIAPANELITQSLNRLTELLQDLQKNPNDTRKTYQAYEEINSLSESMAMTVRLANNINDSDAFTRLTKSAEKMAGKPSTNKKVLGAIFCIVGVVLLALCIAGALHSGGLSLLALPIAKKCIVVGIGISGLTSIGFFASARRKGPSKTVMNVADATIAAKKTLKNQGS